MPDTDESTDGGLRWFIHPLNHLSGYHWTLNDDPCLVLSGNGLLVLGLFRRLATSLFMHRRLRQPKPHQKSFTDFRSLMGENNLASALSFLTSKRPKLP